MKKKTFVKNIIKIIHNDIKLYEKFYNKDLIIFPVFKINNLILNLKIFYFFIKYI
jgi:hypothetical protein